jgi:hypothetical protein
VRVSVLTLLAVLVLAAPARAQDQGTAVVGGGSFNRAPILVPGRYRDTILPGEYLYYGFRLAAGQRLHVTATPAPIDNPTALRLGLIWMSANIHTPTRTVDSLVPQPNEAVGFGPRPETIEVTSGEVAAEEEDRPEGPWASAGVYYLAVHVVSRIIRERDAPAPEIPFTFTAEVQGVAQPNATPTPTPTPTAAATEAPEQEDDDPPAAAAAAGGVGGILIGVIAAVVLRQRRR